MPDKRKRWKEIEAKRRVILDLVRAQFAPVKDGDGNKLFQAIKAEVARLGLPDTDANWFYNRNQREQWVFNGFKIHDPIATINNWHENKFFPSQRK